MLLDEVLHLLLGEGVHGLGKGKGILLRPLLDDLVGAETLLALLAVHKGVGEAAHVAGGHPDLGVHEDGGVQTHIVGVFLDKFLPPGFFDVVLQLNAQGAVVPGVGEATVDFASGEDEASSLTEGYDFFHCFLGVFHFILLLCRLINRVIFAPDRRERDFICGPAGRSAFSFYFLFISSSPPPAANGSDFSNRPGGCAPPDPAPTEIVHGHIEWPRII